MIADLIIPALDEEASIGVVLAAVPRPPIRSVIVVDNGSADATGVVARRAGAIVIHEPRRGYGSACLAGLRALPVDTEIVVFLDADGSDDPGRTAALLRPILEDRADFVLGARVTALAEPGALTLPQRVGNAIAGAWLRTRFGLQASDLGPFRAIRRASLDALRMSDRGYGWTVEMQIKAARAGLRYLELAVPCRRRVAGASKVSGTAAGTLGAAAKILGRLAWHDFADIATRGAHRATRRDVESRRGPRVRRSRGPGAMSPLQQEATER